jgi:hypothetical protein
MGLECRSGCSESENDIHENGKLGLNHVVLAASRSHAQVYEFQSSSVADCEAGGPS